MVGLLPCNSVKAISEWPVDQYPDFLIPLHIRIGLLGNFSVSGGVPRISSTDGSQGFICKHGTQPASHFLIGCPLCTIKIFGGGQR